MAAFCMSPTVEAIHERMFSVRSGVLSRMKSPRWPGGCRDALTIAPAAAKARASSSANAPSRLYLETNCVGMWT